MGLKDSLRKAEEQGRDATRRVLEHAREQWGDAERRIRASMRVHPRPKPQSSATKSSFVVQPQARTESADPALDQEMKNVASKPLRKNSSAA